MSVPAGPLCTVASRARCWAGYQSAIIAPVEADPRTDLPRLVLHVTGEVELFVVIDPERPRCGGNRARPADLGSEKAGSYAGEHYEAGEPVKVRYAHTARVSWNLRAVPLDRERDRRGAEHAEVVGIVRVLPDVLARKDKILPESLLESRVEFIAPARTKRGYV